MTCYDNEYITIKYFEKEKLLFSKYHGFVPSEEFRKILDFSIEVLSRYDIELGLADQVEMKAIRPADQDYVNNIWFPQFLEVSKIVKSATVESTDVFNKMATDSLLKKLEGKIPFEIHFFNSIEKACQWLNVDMNIISL